ncbi:guanosine monophosphate reductase [bacterium]|nr:guanosine monophosphate reductase [bacterium]
MSEVFSFDDILLVPQKSDISSRDEIDIKTSCGKIDLSVPIFSSPMDTVTESEMAAAMAGAGAMGVLHRYNTVADQTSMFVSSAEKANPIAIAAAIGITGDFKERASSLYNAGCRVFCLDVAHGHHTMMEAALKMIRDKYGDTCTLIAGNVATNQGFSDLSSWGADIVRVGIGGGSICSTRVQTGHGLPTLYSVMVCATQKEIEGLDTLILADGGIRNSGDIVKSLAAGADAVMLGSLLAGTTESPGQTISTLSGAKQKVYRGMASREAQIDWRGKARSMEGISSTVPLQGPVARVIEELAFSIKSGLSYSGARSIKEFQVIAKTVIQTPASQTESQTHIILRN